jgi:LysM repeat protein
MSIDAVNVQAVDDAFDARLLDAYVYGGEYDSNRQDGADCSYVVSWVIRGYLLGLNGFDWLTHPVSTESWPYTYDPSAPNGGIPAAPGTVGPYGTVAIAGPNDQSPDSALLICIMHQGGGEDSHMNCLTGPAITPTWLAAPAGKIMESNGDAGTCTNGDGGTPADSDIWTDWWELPGPIVGGPPPSAPPAPPQSATYTVQEGDTLSSIADRLGVSLSALEAANPQITDPSFIMPGELVNIP